MKNKQFLQIPYNWFELIPRYDLSAEDINLLVIINNLNKTQYKCIANDSYLENILKVPNIRFNIARLEKSNLIKINNGKVRTMSVNNEIIDKL